RALSHVRDEYDVVLIDCPPSLGVLTINGLSAASEVLIPLQCGALSHRGVGQLLETIDDVRMFANADLAVRGVIATMYDDRTRHGRAVLEDVRTRYGLEVLEPPVRKSIRFAEAPEQGLCILQHAPGSPGAEAYRTLAATLDGAWRN
ncbi:MAG: ParA family protein, partial [Acidimicrobiales bacterium]